MLVHVGRGQRAEGRMREEARGSRQVPALARPGCTSAFRLQEGPLPPSIKFCIFFSL